jgi:2'-5' RNA ligase
MHDECGGRMMQASNIHLTLVFIGNVPARRVEDLLVLAGGIATPQFELTIDAVEYWRHNRIVWVGPRMCPDALRLLAEALADALRGADFRIEERPYAPHITLLRDARRAPVMRTAPNIHWHLTEFALVQSSHRDRVLAYEPIRRWPLHEGA